MFHVKQLIKARQSAERRQELGVYTVSGRNAGMGLWRLSPFALNDVSRVGQGKELTAKIAGRKEYSIAEGTASQLQGAPRLLRQEERAFLAAEWGTDAGRAGRMFHVEQVL